MAFTDVVGLFHLILLLSAIIFLSQDLQWDKIDVQTLGESRFRAIPTLHLAVFRSLCATLVMGSTLYLTLSPTPLCVTVQLKGGRKKLVSLLHFERFSMFTVWSWLMLGLYFSGAAYCSYVALRGGAPSTLTLRVVWVLFEVCFPIAFIVSSIVTFLLIPNAKRNHMPVANFYCALPLLMHNGNVILMAVEIIINKIPFCRWHFPYILFYGMAYAVFSWLWYLKHHYFFYFFLDYTKPRAWAWYAALKAVVTAYFFLGCWASQMMNSFESCVPPVIIILVTLSIVKLYE